MAKLPISQSGVKPSRKFPLAQNSQWLVLWLPGSFLLAFLIFPLLGMFVKSFYDGSFTIEYYQRFFDSPLYSRVLFSTFKISLLISVLCLLLGYPVAYTMARAGEKTRSIIMALVLIPFWTSLLVRAYAWMVMLQNQGVVNGFLIKLGLITEPLQLLYNTTGVLLGMTHIMLPYMIISLNSVMAQIDKNLLAVSKSLGAGDMRTFFQVFLPLSIPGMVSGFTLVFLTTLGYYIVPALLGGQKSTMLSQLIQTQVGSMLNWNFASAISFILIGVTLVLLLISDYITRSKS